MKLSIVAAHIAGHYSPMAGKSDGLLGTVFPGTRNLELNAERSIEIRTPYPSDEMEAWEVSKAVNSPRNDEPKLVEPYKNI